MNKWTKNDKYQNVFSNKVWFHRCQSRVDLDTMWKMFYIIMTAGLFGFF